MTTSLVSTGDPGAVTRTIEVLTAGGVVVVPTDTVYGLGASPAVAGATAALFAAKDRAADVPLAVLCATTDDALALADLSDPVVAERAHRWAAAHWPGPLTLVLPRRANLGWELGEPTSTIGVRVPDHDFIRAVAAEVGPIAVTSANRHGAPTPPTATAAAESLLVPPALVVDGGRLEAAASTVVSVATGEILRAGRVIVAVEKGELHDRNKPW